MLASFPGFPSSFSRTASDGKLEGKPGNEATAYCLTNLAEGLSNLGDFTRSSLHLRFQPLYKVQHSYHFTEEVTCCLGRGEREEGGDEGIHVHV